MSAGARFQGQYWPEVMLRLLLSTGSNPVTSIRIFVNSYLCIRYGMYLVKQTNWQLTTTSLKSSGDHCAYQKPMVQLGDSQYIASLRIPNFDANEISLMT